jgi:hypothetical protein
MLASSAGIALGFLLLASFIIALGASSTARYEFDRNRVHVPVRQPAAGAGSGPGGWPGDDHAWANAAGAPASQETRAEQGSAVGVATHPAGRRLGEPASEPAWWLVDEPGEQAGEFVVAGPFADQIDADWAALSGGLSASVRAVHGVQRADGTLLRRPLSREKAWLNELGAQLDRLPEDWDDLLTDDDALTTLVVEVAAALVEAGLPLHDCAGESPAGGVCLIPGPHYGGVVVSWHEHDRMSAQQVRGAAVEQVVRRTMNATIADLLDRMGFEIEPFGDAGCCLVTDVRGIG